MAVTPSLRRTREFMPRSEAAAAEHATKGGL